MWDVGAVTARMWLMSGIGANREMKERIKESNSKKGDIMGHAKDRPITTVQYGDTNVDVASKMAKVEEEVQVQTKNATHHDRGEDNTDKYDFIIPDITETSHFPFELASANPQTHPKLSGQYAEPYLHFSAGCGFTQGMQRPLLQFNAVYCDLPKHPLSTFEGDRNAFRIIM